MPKNIVLLPANRNIMKKVLLVAIAVFFTLQGFSQYINESTRKKFSTVFDIYTDIWMDVPDSIDTRTINQGINFLGLYDYRFGKSNFSFAFGAGIGSHNFYSNGVVVEDTSGNSQLHPFKSLYPNKNYDRNKISYTYVDIPIEFRLRTKKDIRAALGFKFGFLIDSHTKYKGDDYLNPESNDYLFVKFKDVPNIETFRYGISARFGWKFINLTGFYSLTGLFKKDQGPELYPISVGISLMPF